MDRLRLPGLVPLTAVIPRVYWSQLPHPQSFITQWTTAGILIPTHCTVSMRAGVRPFKVAFLPAGGSQSIHTLRIMTEFHRYSKEFDPFPLLPLLLPNHYMHRENIHRCVCPHTFLHPLDNRLSVSSVFFSDSVPQGRINVSCERRLNPTIPLLLGTDPITESQPTTNGPPPKPSPSPPSTFTASERSVDGYHLGRLTGNPVRTGCFLKPLESASIRRVIIVFYCDPHWNGTTGGGLLPPGPSNLPCIRIQTNNWKKKHLCAIDGLVPRGMRPL